MTVQVDRDETGRRVDLSIPGGHLTAETARALVRAADELVEDRSIRVVLLRSRSRDFCAGPDERLDPSDLSVDPASAIARLRPPVVVHITGVCRSVGLELALACDLRFLAPEVLLGVPDVGEGRLPMWGGLPRLTRSVGRSMALRMLLLGEELSTTDAVAVGLGQEVRPGHEGRAEVDALVSRLSRQAPLAMELAKEAVHRGMDVPFGEALRLEAELNHLLASTGDRAEGIRAFFDRRPADFGGR